jgi:translation elongation factor EF-1alpha
METKLNEKSYINIAIFGDINSGKCSLAKSLSIESGCIATPNHITFKDKYYYLTKIACCEEDYRETYDLSIFLCDIALIVIDLKSFNDNITYYDNIIKHLFIKGVNNVIICINKLDIYEISKDQLDKLKYSLSNFIETKDMKFLYPQNTMSFNFIGISAKEGTNIKDFTVNYGLFDEVSLLDCLYRIQLPDLSKSKTLFEIYDSYFDNEEKLTVISGKVIYGTLTLGEEYSFQPLNGKIKVTKLCDCNGQYLNQISYNSFTTVRI